MLVIAGAVLAQGRGGGGAPASGGWHGGGGNPSGGKGKANPVVRCEDSDRSASIKCLEPNRRVEVEHITVERRVG
jgi:hypothetical protein